MLVRCLLYFSTLKFDATWSPKRGLFQRTKRRYILEDRIAHNHCSVNLKSYTYTVKKQQLKRIMQSFIKFIKVINVHEGSETLIFCSVSTLSDPPSTKLTNIWHGYQHNCSSQVPGMVSPLQFVTDIVRLFWRNTLPTPATKIALFYVDGPLCFIDPFVE
jgi:hypothetical protein